MTTLNFDYQILEALQKMVATIVGTEAAGNPPVRYVGRNAEKSWGMYWEVVFIPNNIENEFLADGKTYQGVLRLILHSPQDDKGAAGPMVEVKRVADQIVKGTRYSDDSSLVQVQIQDHPNAMGPIEESPEMLNPLTVRYSFFKI